MQLTVIIVRRIRLEMHKQLGFCTNADTEILKYESSKSDRMLTVYTAWASCFLTYATINTETSKAQWQIVM